MELINSTDVRVAECTGVRWGEGRGGQETTAERRASPIGVANAGRAPRTPPLQEGRAKAAFCRLRTAGRKLGYPLPFPAHNEQRSMVTADIRRELRPFCPPRAALALLFRPSLVSVSSASVALSITGVQLSDVRGRAHTTGTRWKNKGDEKAHC